MLAKEVPTLVSFSIKMFVYFFFFSKEGFLPNLVRLTKILLKEETVCGKYTVPFSSWENATHQLLLDLVLESEVRKSGILVGRMVCTVSSLS